MRKRKSDAWGGLDLALLLMWFGATTAALAIKHSQLFVGFDGGYTRDVARRQFEWGVPALSTSIDLLQGVGDLFFSSMNFTLMPSYIVGSWFGVTVAAKVAIYSIALMELTLAVILFARTLGVGRTQAVTAAVVLPLLAFPLYQSGALYPVLALSPQLASFIAASLVISAAYLKFGQRDARQEWPYAAIFLGLGLWFVHSGILILVLAGPSFAISSLAGIVAARDGRERRDKLALLAGTSIVFAPPLAYLLGLLLNTAPITAPIELANNRATLEFASVLFHWRTYGPAGPILVVSAVLGALLASFDRSNPLLRIFAITLLSYFTSRMAFWIATVVFDFWRGPSALYFEFFVYPLYAIFAVLFFSRLTASVTIPIIARSSGQQQRAATIVVAGLVVILLAFSTHSPSFGFSYPPTSNKFTRVLQFDIGLALPGPFRGRVETLTGRMIDERVSWPDLHSLDFKLERTFGNEMRVFGLHYFDIPGLFQYGSTMTPAFYAVTSRLLSDPRDRQQRSVSVLRRYDPKVLALLGVSHVLTDAPIGDAELVSDMGADDRRLYLYRVPRPNVANYSPTQVSVATTATEALVRMAGQNFDPSRDVITNTPIEGSDLKEARGGRMIFDGVHLRVTASSDGRSILLLPLEYSRCLAVITRSGSARLFRADVLLTGVLFSGKLDADIALRTGPFIDPICRLHDLADLWMFKVQDIPADVRSPPDF